MGIRVLECLGLIGSIRSLRVIRGCKDSVGY